jgi:hypothetical protein
MRSVVAPAGERRFSLALPIEKQATPLWAAASASHSERSDVHKTIRLPAARQPSVCEKMVSVSPDSRSIRPRATACIPHHRR